MHEAAVAQNVVESILSQLSGRRGKVAAVTISCGQINALNDEAMQFAFEAATEGTICQGAKLKIKHIPLKGFCRDCANKFDFDLYNPQCPRCGKDDFSLDEDAPLLLEEIEFEEN